MQVVHHPVRSSVALIGVLLLGVNGARVARSKDASKGSFVPEDAGALLEKFSADLQDSDVSEDVSSPEVRVSSGGFDGGESIKTGSSFPEMEEMSRQMDEISTHMSKMPGSTGGSGSPKERKAAALAIEEMLGNMRSLVNKAAEGFRAGAEKKPSPALSNENVELAPVPNVQKVRSFADRLGRGMMNRIKGNRRSFEAL
mmetsp:Transcript_39543/g.62817  ORF Transcript_39543/g.62817 Transcript_39543/m.62817 type:complete len:199 (-) Transcript_39543:179-775(-)|eukprot:CAMPEP_0169152358 /NCGR_PEP_ID=MMETSP1015-20121227/51458_1 /TAXON_ID=342587 /ORGANISM="Karlodinium micrum, Strain CCMP2283" /LENGTH=198 /DNA_ID=CAMNT_0009222121 /DNA_START=86 /DNA_END=682 /DNA_ORIENTATION=+